MKKIIENNEEFFFTGSPDNINKVLEQKKTHKQYLELLGNEKFIEAKNLWDKVIRNTFVVNEYILVEYKRNDF